MPNEIFIAENDSLLTEFLSEADELKAEDCLNRIFEETVIPQIRKVLSSFLTLTSQEKDEIQSDAQACVLGKLRSLRQNHSGKPLKDFTAYCSTVAFNCRKDFILAKKAEWRRIVYRLKRLKDEKDSVWHFFTDGEGSEFYGLNNNSAEQSKLDFDEIAARVREERTNHLFLKTQELVPIILETADGFLARNDLVKAILEITETANFEEIEMPEEMNEFNETGHLLARRQTNYLRRIFDEIKSFPANQRKVLLLSLKETGNVEVITLLLKKRIATIKEIADALEISLEEFSEIFQRLPMKSGEIADFLGITNGEKSSKEQKVDNLRSIARRLLRSRLGIKK